MQNHHIWPTTITESTIQLEDKPSAMEAVFEAIQQGSGEISGEESGVLTLHHDPRLAGIYDQMIDLIRLRLEDLQVDHSNLDINIVKSWPNVLFNRPTPIHSHLDAHMSFTFYLNCPEDAVQNLVFTRTQTDPHPNDPYPFAFGHLATGYDWLNCIGYAVTPQEGSAFVFPSNAAHYTTGRDEYLGEVEKVETLDDLYKTRVCIASDVIFTHKTPHRQTTGIQPIENWRPF